ncbi:RING-H2 finger protein ATL73-like [Herrania umbratica]|uniref:RING-type E3 ubiquitin transferase n=1 Tax=Herrania umbratica TaxID=108875 RepID=A0A6J0ZY94_9ROSI|nr:RING-H2 finger protein ATL73-like [Herrania umbratica]
MPSTPHAPSSPARPGRCSPWVIAPVAIICTTLLVFRYFRVLKRLCCACTAATYSRNQGQRRFLDDSNFDPPPSQNQSNALESTVIHSLPISQYKKENKEEPQPSNTDCAVCLGEFEEGDLLRHLPNCTHAFHISCIDTWFLSHSSCPLCRSSVSELQIRPECSVSMFTIVETLSREDFSQDRAAHYQMLRSEVLRNSALTYAATGGR